MRLGTVKTWSPVVTYREISGNCRVAPCIPSDRRNLSPRGRVYRMDAGYVMDALLHLISRDVVVMYISNQRGDIGKPRRRPLPITHTRAARAIPLTDRSTPPTTQPGQP